MKPLQPYHTLAQSAGISIKSPHLYTKSFPLLQYFPIYWTKNVLDKFWYLLLALSAVWMLTSVNLIPPTNDSLSEYLSIILLFLVWVGGIMVISLALIAIITWITSTKFAPAELAISSIVLRPSDTFEIHYQQQVKHQTTLNSLSFALILRESITEGSGRSMKTINHDTVIEEEKMPNVTFSPDQPINYSHTYTIPPDATHSYETDSNKLLWLLQVKMDVPNFPDYQREYKLQVISEVNNEI